MQYKVQHWPGKIGASKSKMEGRPCCSVVIFGLFLLTHGQLFHQSEAVNSKFLPVVINTWGPPFTNATAEGMTCAHAK